MFPVTITLHNPTQLNAVMAAMGTEFQPAMAQAEAPQPAQTEKPTQAKAQTTKVKTDPKPDAAPTSEPAQTASNNSENSSKESTAANDTEQPSYQDVAALITKVSRSVSRDAAVKILNHFGAKKGPELKPEQYADVITACNEVLA